MIKKIINLLKVKKSISGRGAKGNLVCYSKGGASSKRFYRLINFINDFLNIPCVILSLQKDPNRTALIMLICYKNGYLSYNIAFKHSEVGGILFFSCNKFLYSKGDSILLKFLTLGSTVYNIFNNTNKKIYIRAGGSYGKIITHKQNFSLLELKSGEYKLFNNNNLINAGSVFLKTDSSKNKAGKSRRLSWRPKVRGIAKNPVDHPNGGRSNKGKLSRTMWGKLSKGKRTYSKKLLSKFIIKKKFQTFF